MLNDSVVPVELWPLDCSSIGRDVRPPSPFCRPDGLVGSRVGGNGRHGAPIVAVLEKRGRFLTATPFFARAGRINLDKPRSGTVRPGDLVLVKGSRGIRTDVVADRIKAESV